MVEASPTSRMAEIHASRQKTWASATVPPTQRIASVVPERAQPVM